MAFLSTTECGPLDVAAVPRRDVASFVYGRVTADDPVVSTTPRSNAIRVEQVWR